jgi:zinc/manganese transport system permease protein
MIDMATLFSILFEPGFFTSEPVRTAALIGGAATIVSGVVGVFTVMRGQSFAGHSLADVSSAGGSAAFLFGINPLLGFLGMGVLAATSMELVRADRASERDLVRGSALPRCSSIST